MQGIWAAAPYLHNGSVPTLADLLKPPRDRPKKFEVGNRYDTALVGLARNQAPGAEERDTRGCSDDAQVGRKPLRPRISEPTSATPRREPCSNI